MEESLGWGRRKEVFVEDRDSGVTRGARWADRVSSSRHVPHVSIDGDTCHRSAVRKYHWPWFKYSNKIITSSSSVSLSIISDGSFVHFLVSVALMIKKYFESFFGVKIIYLHQVLEQGRRWYYPPISLSSVYLWYLGVRFTLPRSLCILYRLQVPSLGRWSFISCQRWQIPSITTSTVSAIIQQSFTSYPANVDVLGIWTKCLEALSVLLNKCLDNIKIHHLRS